MDEQKAKAGRPKGSKNKRSEEMAVLIAAIPGYIDPAEFLATVLADTTADQQVRIKCALELMPYRYPKLKQIEMSGVNGEAISNTYTWLPPEPEGTIPMATATMSMDELDDEDEGEPTDE